MNKNQMLLFCLGMASGACFALSGVAMSPYWTTKKPEPFDPGIIQITIIEGIYKQSSTISCRVKKAEELKGTAK